MTQTAPPATDSARLTAQANALKARGQLNQAIALYQSALAAAPASAAAEHNLAAALGDAGRWREAEAHIIQAFAKGGDAPESWLILGRCRQSAGVMDEAERAFLSALARRPTYTEAHKDLAQLRWMQSADAASALSELDKALVAQSNHPGLMLAKARTLEAMEQIEAAYAEIQRAAVQHPHDLAVIVTAAQLAAQSDDATAALHYGERAYRAAPHESVVLSTLAGACLAAGDVRRAGAIADQLVRQSPQDQYAIALLSTAWRLLGDERYALLYDYNTLVRSYEIAAPRGWKTTASYLADLGALLRSAHVAQTHPFHQSIRNGSQIADVLTLDHPAARALPEALGPCIAAYLRALGEGSDPLRMRNTGAYSYQGLWSIRMQAGGRHIDHVHPNGWVSSACYIEVPPLTDDREGWIRFGKPGIATKPSLDAEHFIAPSVGALVLFPSYMWHGVSPYATPGARMTIAFDLSPGVQNTG